MMASLTEGRQSLLFALGPLAAKLLELGEHALDVELFLLARFRLRRYRSVRGGRSRKQRRSPVDLGLDRLLLGGALDLEVEIDLRTQAQRHRIHGRQVRRVPVRAVADRLD